MSHPSSHAPGAAAPLSREILDDVAGILRAYFALEHWGRLLVETAVDGAGAVQLCDVQVEEIIGDESLVERAFASREARALAPAVARAVEALAALHQVELKDVGGGTFIRTDGAHGELVFLPGLVSAPSRVFDAALDEIAAFLERTAAELQTGFGIDAGAELRADMFAGTLEVFRGDELVTTGRQVVIGSFSRPNRSWVWGAHNPSLDPQARARSRQMLDRMPERKAWELSTPGFATDEPGAWALAGWLARAEGLQGVGRVHVPEGFVALGLSDLRRT